MLFFPYVNVKNAPDDISDFTSMEMVILSRPSKNPVGSWPYVSLLPSSCSTLLPLSSSYTTFAFPNMEPSSAVSFPVAVSLITLPSMLSKVYSNTGSSASSSGSPGSDDSSPYFSRSLASSAFDSLITVPWRNRPSTKDA